MQKFHADAKVFIDTPKHDMTITLHRLIHFDACLDPTRMVDDRECQFLSAASYPL
jgi:hypothetical protein